MLLRTIPGLTKETFQTNYLGTFLYIQSLTNGDLSDDIELKIVPLGDGVITDLNGGGVREVGKWNMIGAGGLTSKRVIPLSDGLISNKVVDITCDNQSEDSIQLFMPILKQGTMYIQTLQQTILGASQAVFTDFSALFLSAIDDIGDQITVDWNDGSSHTFAAKELEFMMLLQQESQQKILDNTDGRIKKVTIIPVSDSIVWMARYRNIGNL